MREKKITSYFRKIKIIVLVYWMEKTFALYGHWKLQKRGTLPNMFTFFAGRFVLRFSRRLFRNLIWIRSDHNKKKSFLVSTRDQRRSLESYWVRFWCLLTSCALKIWRAYFFPQSTRVIQLESPVRDEVEHIRQTKQKLCWEKHRAWHKSSSNITLSVTAQRVWFSSKHNFGHATHREPHFL